MYRVYCKIGTYRYYWTKSRIWSMWGWTAQPLTLEQAEQKAQEEDAFVEPMGG